MLLSFRLAFRYLLSPRKGSFSSFASWLAIAGLGIGIAALMLTASIIHGFETTVSRKISSFDGIARIQHILGKPVSLSENKLGSFIAETNKHYDVLPFVRGMSMVRSGPHADGILIEGVNKLSPALLIDWLNPRSQKQLKKGEIILGKQLADLLKVKIGNTVFVEKLAEKSTRNIKPFTVIGQYHSGLSEYDKILAYVNIKDAQSLMGYNEDIATGWVLYSNELTNQTIPDIPYPYVLETWHQRHALLFEWIQLQQWPAFIMFGLIALVGIVNIIAALAMIIVEKKAQIGILISQGFSKPNIQMVFMIQGGFIGIMGGLFGGLAALGIIFLQLKFELLTISEEIYFMNQIPMAFDKPMFFIILILSYILCMAASWWPSKTIFKLKPSEALLNE